MSAPKLDGADTRTTDAAGAHYAVRCTCRRYGTGRDGGDVRVSASGLASWRSGSVNASMISVPRRRGCVVPIVICTYVEARWSDVATAMGWKQQRTKRRSWLATREP